MPSLLVFFALGVLVAWWAYGRFLAKTNPLPPGPKPLFFIGNLHQLPKVDPFKTYADWKNIYGPIIYFHVFGRQFVVLNTLKAAFDLFEKRSNLYSTKPRLVMAGELVAREKTSILFLKYGPRLKEARRLVHSWINKNTVRQSWPAQIFSSHKLLGVLLDDPERFSEHIRTQSGSLILKLTYGIECAPVNDPHIAMSEKLSKITAQATQPGKWLCDSFPFLAYIPPWFPMAGFRRWGIQARKVSTELVRTPFEMVRTSVLNGTVVPSWTANEIFDDQGHVKSAEDAQDLVTAAGTMYSGGIDTTVGAIRTFFLMMARNPEVQRKAQAEIDKVIGHDRLPDMSDRDSLPYLSKLITEVLRINPIAPLVPHSLDEDDFYEGYLIPKGSWVMVNLWAILHDPVVYRSPEEFRPERFEASEDHPAEPDCTQAAFGFGRRACPGVHFAMSTIFINLAQILSVFNIEPCKDSEGRAEVPPLLFDAGHLRSPRAFKCNIVPRSSEKINLVRQAIISSTSN